MPKHNAWSAASPPSAWKIRDTLINGLALPSSSIRGFAHPKQKPVQRRSPQIPDAPINGGEIRWHVQIPYYLKPLRSLQDQLVDSEFERHFATASDALIF